MHSNEQTKSLLQAVTRYAEGLDEASVAYLNGRGISKDVAEQFSLGTVTEPINGHEQFIGWLSIPYFSAMGICTSVKFRRIDEGKPKYGQPLGQKLHIYNVSDVLVDSGFIAAWKPFYSKLFGGFDKIFILGDNDIKEDGTNPGAEFSRRVASEVMNSQIVQLPQGMDVNEYYLTNGAESVRELLGVAK
jgi:hypothetical protein